MTNLDQLRYPIGKFKSPENISHQDIEKWIHIIGKFPVRIKSAVAGLSDEQLEWQYRPEGWSIRQLVHHCADSHLNSQLRFRLALTEETPTIKPYKEAEWAKLADVGGPVSWSLELLTGLHARWTDLLSSLGERELAREYFHPEQNRKIRLDATIALYSWHCEHHLAHIELAKKHAGKY